MYALFISDILCAFEIALRINYGILSPKSEYLETVEQHFTSFASEHILEPEAAPYLGFLTMSSNMAISRITVLWPSSGRKPTAYEAINIYAYVF